MRRISLTALGFALLFSGIQLYAQTNATVEKALEAKEHVGWQSWKDHNAKPLDPLTPDDVLNIADGTVTRGKQQVLHEIESSNCDVNSFALSDFSYLWLDKNTVLMTYTATQDATCSGKKQAGKVLATSLWQKKGGQWMSPFHQETESE